MYASSIKDAPRTPRYAANPTKNKKCKTQKQNAAPFEPPLGGEVRYPDERHLQSKSTLSPL
jgi:hypothetical protein